jgi:RimJ/RimL family protein N-acetyltransferase
MPITLRSATLMDIPLLVQMNQELIEDEGGSNPMNREQLESRMKRWLTSWQIELFLSGEVVIGYSVYRLQHNDTDNKDIIYIRHYFISREYRRQGLGHKSFKLLKEKRFSKEAKIYLEVLWHNQRGRDFWTSLGFSPYSITMKLE